MGQYMKRCIQCYYYQNAPVDDWCQQCMQGNSLPFFIKSEIDMDDKTAIQKQIGGDHYKKMEIQPMTFSMKNNLNACQHTAIKYISRYKDKDGLKDLLKAKHCIDLLIEFEGYSE